MIVVRVCKILMNRVQLLSGLTVPSFQSQLLLVLLVVEVTRASWWISYNYYVWCALVRVFRIRRVCFRGFSSCVHNLCFQFYVYMCIYVLACTSTGCCIYIFIFISFSGQCKTVSIRSWCASSGDTAIHMAGYWCWVHSLFWLLKWLMVLTCQ